MGIRINTNYTAVNAFNSLSRAAKDLHGSVERLSSGLRINHAQDDPAGLAIAEKIRTQVKGLARASMNAQDGVSLLQTAESALGEIQNMLQRVRELAIQAASGTLTANDRVEIQREVDQLLSEVDRTASATEFNTKTLLNGNLSALVSTDNGALRPIITGDKVVAGNYRLETQMTPGQGQVLKSDIFRIVKGEQYKMGTRGSAEDIDPGSDFLAFQRQVAANDTDLVVRNSSGTEWTIDTDNTAANAAISPDGTKVAYTKNVGGVAQVFTYDLTKIGTPAATTQPVQISAAANAASLPQWSADGRSLLFLSNNDVFTVDASTPTAAVGTNITGAIGNVGAASWAPVGTRILVDTATDLEILEADGTVVATFGDANSANAVWSPDGTKVLFNNATDVFVYDIASSGTTQLTAMAANTTASAAVWSRDGSRIAYVRDIDGTANNDFRIYVMNADGSGQVQTAASSANGGNTATQANLAWSTDGDWVYYLADTYTGNAATNYAVARARSDGTTGAEQFLTGAVGAASAVGEEIQLDFGRAGFWVTGAGVPTGADFTLWQEIDYSLAPDDSRFPGSSNTKQDFAVQYSIGHQVVTGLTGTVVTAAGSGSWTAAGTASFTVIAYDANGVEIGRSATGSAVITANANQTISAAWDAVSGATNYRIYYVDPTVANLEYVSTATTSYSLTGTGTATASPNLPTQAELTPDRFGVVDYKTASTWDTFQTTRAGTLSSDTYTDNAPYVLLEVVGVRVTDPNAQYSIQGDKMVIDSTLLDGGAPTQRIQMRATTYTRTGEVVQQKTFEMDAAQWIASHDILDGSGFADLEGDYDQTTVRMGANGNTVTVGDKVLLLYDNKTQYGSGTLWATQNRGDTGSYMLDINGTSVATGTLADRVGARIGAPAASAFLTGVDFSQSVAWLDQAGNMHIGTGDVRFTTQPTQQVAFNLMQSDLAERVTELQWVDRFQVASSLFDLTARTVTIYGNSHQADVVLEARDKLEDVAQKFRQAILRGVADGGLGMSVDDNVTSSGIDYNTAVYVTNSTPNTDEAVTGTLVLRSTVPSTDGRLFFSGDERVLNAFSWAEVRKADLNSLDVNVYDAHTGRWLDHKVVNDNVLRSSIPGVNVLIDGGNDVKVEWNPTTKTFDFTSDFGKALANVHVAASPMTLQVGANIGQTLDAIVGEVTRYGLELDKLLMVSRDAAEEALVRVDKAIGTVSSQRARIGAYISRLTTTMNILDITQENMTASESRIRDLDMAQETIKFTKDQMLVQAATSMLAQANQLPQTVLVLLR